MPDSLCRSGLTRLLWGDQIVMSTPYMKIYCNGDFTVKLEREVKFYHRSWMNRLIWAGTGVRVHGKWRIPLYVTDDFGCLVKIGEK